MARDLAIKYGRQIKSLILSNAAFADVRSSAKPVHNRSTLAIGLLSNLTSEKGLYEFLEIVRNAKLQGLPIRAVLAGPVKTEGDRVFLETVREEVGDYLDYRGAVYDEEKSCFFDAIDIFVFLTTYPNEAQPMVLFEAMSRGIPVISYDRGCIRSQVADAGLVFSDGTNIVAKVVSAVMRYHNDLDWMSEQKEAAFRQFEDEQRRGQSVVATLFDADPIEFRADT
jgi:glycosyltransferase involved in cell wall biosynthesis